MMGKNYSYISNRLAIWPTLPLNTHFRKPSDKMPYPLDQINCRVYSRARQGIWNACKALDLKQSDIILVPAYHHGSEIEAILQAGVQIIFYEVTENLEPDPVELETLLSCNVRALYLIHYLGFPQDGSYWKKWCDERSILLIEDAAQAFLSTSDGKPVGSFGQVGIFCLYKTYGIPDGGAVVSTYPLKQPASSPQSGAWRMIKRHLNWIAARRSEIGLLHAIVKPVFSWFKRVNEHQHAEFDLGDTSAPISSMANYLLPKIIDEKTVEIRRQNYAFLLQHLNELVPYPFKNLTEGASPFAFPIKVNNAPIFLTNLRRKGVLGILFWLNPHPSLTIKEFSRSKELRESMLALPVHQELRKSDLIKIVKAVKECYASQELNMAVSV